MISILMDDLLFLLFLGETELFTSLPPLPPWLDLLLLPEPLLLFLIIPSSSSSLDHLEILAGGADELVWRAGAITDIEV